MPNDKDVQRLIGSFSYLTTKIEHLEMVLREFPEIFEDETTYFIEQQVARYESDPNYLAGQLEVSKRPDWLYQFKLRLALIHHLRHYGIGQGISFQQRLLEHLAELLVNLVGIDAFSDIKKYLHEHEIVLKSNETILVLDHLIRLNREKFPVWEKRALKVREVLLTCMERGIDKGLDYLENGKVEELVQLIMKFAFAPSWNQSQQMVEENPDLLSPQVDGLLTALIQHASDKGDEDLYIRLREHQKILQKCNAEGIEQAFQFAVSETHARRATRAEEEGKDIQSKIQFWIGSLQKAHEEKRYAEAIEIATEIVEAVKKHLSNFLMYCQICIWMGRIYQEWHENQPDPERDFLGNAVIRLEEAWALLEQADQEGREEDQSMQRMKSDCSYLLAGIFFQQSSDSPSAHHKKVVLWYQKALSNAVDRSDLPFLHFRLATAQTQLIPYLSEPDRSQAIEQACQSIESCILHYTATKHPGTYAQARLVQASAMMQGDLDQDTFSFAGRYLEEALDIFTFKGMLRNWYDCHFNLMQLYAMRKDTFSLADEHFNLAASHAQQQQDDAQWIKFHVKYGDILIHQSRYQAAVAIYNELLQKHLLTSSPEQVGKIHQELCTAYYYLYTETYSAEHQIRCIEHGEAACNLLPSHKNGFTRYFLGSLYNPELQGNYQENLESSIKHLTQFIQNAESEITLAPKLILASAFDLLANRWIDRQLGDRAENLEKAIHLGQKGLIITSVKEHPHQVGNLHNTLAIGFLRRVKGNSSENLEESISHSSQAIRIRQELNTPSATARSMVNLGNAYMHRQVGNESENLQQAKKLFQEAVPYFDQVLEPRDWAGIINNLGAICAKQKDYEAAAQYYEQVLQVYTRDTFPERWVVTRQNLVAALSNLWGASEYQPLIDILKENLEILAPGRDDQERQKQLQSAAELCMQKGDYAQAHLFFLEAFQICDQKLAEAYSDAGKRYELEDISRLYSKDAYCLALMGDYQGAFEQLELGKNHLLREQFMFLEADTALEAQRGEIAQVTEQLTVLRAEQFLPLNAPGRRSERVLNKLLEESTSRFYTLLGEKSPKFNLFQQPGFEVKSLIPPDGALVFPMLTREGLLLFILTHQHPVPTAFNTTSYDLSTVHALISNLSGEALTEMGLTHLTTEKGIDLLCKHLWDAFTGKICEKILEAGAKKDSEIVLFPHEFLNRLPWAASWRWENGEKRALLDDFTVSVCPSLHAWFLAKKRASRTEQSTPSFLGIANPTGDLPFAAKESEAISDLYVKHGKSHLVLAGKEATKAALAHSIDQYTHIHFACHGTFNQNDPFQSGIILNNGHIFSIRDFYAHRLFDNVRMVTLSACETGVTDLYHAGEAVSLPGTLIQCGAPAVIGTMWAIHDYASMLLMRRFYQHLLEENKPPALALRMAQRWLKSVQQTELRSEMLRLLPEMDENRIRGVLTAWVTDNDTSYPFASAYYWGGFACFGA